MADVLERKTLVVQRLRQRHLDDRGDTAIGLLLLHPADRPLAQRRALEDAVGARDELLGYERLVGRELRLRAGDVDVHQLHPLAGRAVAVAACRYLPPRELGL